MQAENRAARRIAPDWSNLLAGLSNRALKSKRIRKTVFDNVRMRLIDQMLPPSQIPPRVLEDQKRIIHCLLNTVERAMDCEGISDQFVQRTLRNMIRSLLFNSDKVKAYEKFKAEHDGQGPPGFLVISPFKGCNLRCKGCYASSGSHKEKLEWDVFDTIITQAKELWGSWFFTISGGEPLAYRSQGKDLLDMVEKHNDCTFQMYTNGTLIDKEVAARMAKAGNITPAISVEGFQEATDDRRGEGVFNKILTAMGHLREAGVPFGISITATRFNCEEILSDALFDFFFGEQGALYAWLFQYMPIGRGFTLDLLPTPEQRVWIMPCPMRDHHARARQIINTYEPEPEDEAAAEALADPAYYEGLVAYDHKVAALADPLWREKYLASFREEKVRAAGS